MTNIDSHDWAAQPSDYPIVQTAITVTGSSLPPVPIQLGRVVHDPHGTTSVPDGCRKHEIAPCVVLADKQIILSKREQMIRLTDQQNLQWLRSHVDRYDYLFMTVTFRSDCNDGTWFLSLFDEWFTNRVDCLIRGRTSTVNSRLIKPMTFMREFECHSDHRINCPAHIHAIVGVPKHAPSMRRLRVHLPKAIRSQGIIHDIDIQDCISSDLENRYWCIRKTHLRHRPFAGS
jgi:hypothetical protein